MNKAILFTILVLWLDSSVGQAQLFGTPRTVGRPLAPRENAAAQQENVGTLTGSERFLRGNRGRAAFVGADQRETQSFVGSQQARTSGTIVSSTAGISPPPNRSSQINQPLKQPASGQMYLPQVRLPASQLSWPGSRPNVPSVAARVQPTEH